MVRHYCERAERIMSKAFTSQHRIDDYAGNISSFKVARTGSRGVEIAIDPDEGLSARDFSRWGKPGRRQASVQMPGDKEPFVFGAPMRQPSPRELHTDMVGEKAKSSLIRLIRGGVPRRVSARQTRVSAPPLGSGRQLIRGAGSQPAASRLVSTSPAREFSKFSCPTVF